MFSKEYLANHFKARISVLKQPMKYRRNFTLFLFDYFDSDNAISIDLSKKDVKQLIKLLQWVLKQ